jgi:hypothetical protein
MLKKNTTLRHLYLSNNKFEERAAHCFKEALSHNETLLTLDLSWNHFRTNGAVALAEGVQVGPDIIFLAQKVVFVDHCFAKNTGYIHAFKRVICTCM